jgi:hypothetical protein
MGTGVAVLTRGRLGESIGMAEESEPRGRSTDYVRFIIVSGARTGSHMLAQALNSSPHITCFREVFNGRLDFVQFGVEGYDDFRSADIALRKNDPIRFLHERVFCRHPEEIRAVGFKFHYGHHWDFPGLLDALVEDRDIKVLHLRRRNALRTLVSLKFAEKTGIWLEAETKATRANLLKALRHPFKAAGRVRRSLQRPDQPKARPRPRVAVSPEELLEFTVQMNMRAKSFDELFQQHPSMTVFYEDLVDQPETAYGRAQTFLGVEPASLTVTLRRQNPEPLRELIENYDELYAALKDTPVASLLD